MKVYITTNSPLLLAFLQVIRFDEHNQQMAETFEEADVIMTTNFAELRGLYTKYHDTKFFVLLDPGQDRSDSPEDNVFMTGSEELRTEAIHAAVRVVRKYHIWAKNRNNKPEQEARKASLGNIVELSKSYTILVVDDNPENLQTAVERLVGQQLIPVSSPAEVLKLLKFDDDREKPSIDAVLTDLNMTPDNMHPSLNLDRYGLNEEVPAGISVMFEATKRGLPVAIVTDANHHQDWFSAMFDHMKEATVNGQKVIFCQEGGGKRWDVVLKKLMEGEES